MKIKIVRGVYGILDINPNVFENAEADACIKSFA